MYKSTQALCAVCDKDHVIAVSGISKKEALDKRVGADLEQIIIANQTYSQKEVIKPIALLDGIDKFYVVTAGTISTAGDALGAVIFFSQDENQIATDMDEKFTQMGALFLGKQFDM